MPFLLAMIKCVAISHLCSGMCDRSITVPVLTVNLSRHPEQKNQPGPMLLPPSGWAVSCWPQNGQIAPFGQREASRNSRALVSLVKAGLVRSHMAISYNLEHAINCQFSQGHS